MPGLTSESDDLAMLPVSPESEKQPVVICPLRHGLKSPIHRLSFSWACGNTLRVSVFRKPPSEKADGDGEAGGRVVEVKLSNSGDEEVDAARWRRMAYSSVTPFALLQSRKHSLSAASRMSLDIPPYKAEWWEHVIEYSKEISSLLSDRKPPPKSIIEDPKSVVNEIAAPMCLKAAWELLEIFYVDKQSQFWIPERLLDWLADYNSLFSGTLPTIHSKLVDFQQELVGVQSPLPILLRPTSTSPETIHSQPLTPPHREKEGYPVRKRDGELSQPVFGGPFGKKGTKDALKTKETLWRI
ncbi:hypothetical protein MTR67_035928 [Solanum verrucosum]|uniref:Nuclear pore complex protein Nup85 n=1 Tax=Solanum verrucosum TaxID=315347 RepID=A0AAF0ZLY6_SOLVR|nr:hypothetical protein MTR67_035928 [Solanum verrucosum]